MSLRELAGRLEISGPGIGYAVERGEAIVHENDYKLIEEVSYQRPSTHGGKDYHPNLSGFFCAKTVSRHPKTKEMKR